MICTASSLVSEKSYGWASRCSPMPWRSKSGAQLLHRPVERVLGAPGVVRVAGELGVHHRAAQLGGDLQQPAPVAHLGLPLLLVGRGPVEHRDERGDLHPRVGARLADLGDRVPVGLRVAVPEEPVRARARAPGAGIPARPRGAPRRRPTAPRGTSRGRVRPSCRALLVEVRPLPQHHRLPAAGPQGGQPRVTGDGGRVPVPRATGRWCPPPRRRRSTPGTRCRRRGRTARASRPAPAPEYRPALLTTAPALSESSTVPSSQTTSPRMS